MRVSASGAQPPIGTAAQWTLPLTPAPSFQASALHKHSASDTAPRWKVWLVSAGEVSRLSSSRRGEHAARRQEQTHTWAG